MMNENPLSADNSEPVRGEGAAAINPSFPSTFQPTPDERTLAALAHGLAVLNLFAGVGGVIAAAVIWLTQKEKSAWVAWHALQALVFQAIQIVIVVLGVAIIWVIGFAVSFLTVGLGAIVAVPIMILSMFLGLALMAGGTAYSFYGAYQVYQGREFRYIWVGDWMRRRSVPATKFA